MAPMGQVKLSTGQREGRTSRRKMASSSSKILDTWLGAWGLMGLRDGINYGCCVCARGLKTRASNEAHQRLRRSRTYRPQLEMGKKDEKDVDVLSECVGGRRKKDCILKRRRRSMGIKVGGAKRQQEFGLYTVKQRGP